MSDDESVVLPAEIGPDDMVWNFAFGSNLEKSKRTYRTSSVYTDEAPGVARGWRLSFDMPAIPYLEPAMASIEPHREENAGLPNRGALDANVDVHGLCLQMTRSCFDKLYLSEGGPQGRYFLAPVRVHLYRDPDNPILAYAFRTKRQVRLPKSRAPSQRYIALIRNGARQLGLDPHYQEYLAALPYMAVVWPVRLLMEVAVEGIGSPFVKPLRTVLRPSLPRPLFVLGVLLLLPYLLFVGLCTVVSRRTLAVFSSPSTSSPQLSTPK